MDNDNTAHWETAVLDGGPADGLRTRVDARPRVIQVTYPCPVDDRTDGIRVEALYL
ncbi:hypothetical protein [Streptomyces sp. NPDC059272]|uniref:hypothetical protein n=1 Tax=Streptomyces sp. NPDC059272 TaxID=3346800 RepID=UPI0036B8905A